MKEMNNWLIVGLGNPGREYEKTRHNAGWRAIDRIAEKLSCKIDKAKFQGLYGQTTYAGEKVFLLKPQTYMNLSGEAVGEAARFYKIEPGHIIVVSDEMSLAAGKMRIRRKGSAGGHNGLKNIIAHLGTDEFPRIRIGVGAPAPNGEHEEVVDWVIGSVPQAELKLIEETAEKAADACACYIANGPDTAMNRFN